MNAVDMFINNISPEDVANFGGISSQQTGGGNTPGSGDGILNLIGNWYSNWFFPSEEARYFSFSISGNHNMWALVFEGQGPTDTRTMMIVNDVPSQYYFPNYGYSKAGALKFRKGNTYKIKLQLVNPPLNDPYFYWSALMRNHNHSDPKYMMFNDYASKIRTGVQTMLVFGHSFIDNTGGILTQTVKQDNISNFPLSGYSTLYVPKIAIEVSSPKAGNSGNKVVFEGEKVHDFNLHTKETPVKHLVIYHKDVVNPDFTIQDFDINMKLKSTPEIPTNLFTSVNYDSMGWGGNGPGSGFYAHYPFPRIRYETIYRNPKVGGVYNIYYDLGGFERTEFPIVLPLAGPDITQWLLGEINHNRTYGKIVREMAEEKYKSLNFVKREKAVYDIWVEISGGHFDYEIQPQDQSGVAPCGFYRTGVKCWPVTLNGTVVHGQNLNNLLWAVFGRSWGWNSLALELGAHWNQMEQKKLGLSDEWKDPPGSQNSIRNGAMLYEIPASSTLQDLKNFFTPAEVKLMWDTHNYNEDIFWPCNKPYDINKSKLLRPPYILSWLND